MSKRRERGFREEEEEKKGDDGRSLHSITSYLVASSAPIPLERLLPPLEGSPEEGEAAAPGARGLAPLARSAWWRDEEEVAAVSSSASSSSTTPPLLLAGDRAPSPLPDHRIFIFSVLHFFSAFGCWSSDCTRRGRKN